MSQQNTIGLGRQRALFVKEQSAFGTPAVPGASDKVMALDDLSFPPLSPTYVADKQLRDSRDQFSRFEGKTPAGSFTLSIYAKPSGTAGTAPDGAALFKACLGATPSTIPAGLTCLTASTASALKVTASALSATNIGDLLLIEGQVVMISSYAAGTPDTIGITPPLSAVPAVGAAIGRSVNYKAATYLPSLTCLVRDAHTSFLSTDAVVESLSVKIPGNDMATLTFGGQFGRQVATGTDAVGAAGVADGVVTAFPVADCAKFEEGSRFNCESETNIYVSAKSADSGAGILTVVRGSGAAAHAAAAAITPWLPIGTEAGSPVHGKLGSVKVGGVAVSFTALQVDLKNGTKMIDTEAGSNYATDYIEGARAVTGSVKLYFRKDDLKHFRVAQKKTAVTIVAQAGSVAGAIAAVVLQKAELDIPAISGNDQRELDIKFTAFAVNGNDPITLGYL